MDLEQFSPKYYIPDQHLNHDFQCKNTFSLLYYKIQFAILTHLLNNVLNLLALDLMLSLCKTKLIKDFEHLCNIQQSNVITNNRSSVSNSVFSSFTEIKY